MDGVALIRKEVLTKFREYLVRESVLNEINTFFSDADIDRTNVSVNLSGERRVLIEQYYGSLNLANKRDIQKLLVFFEFVLKKAESQSSPELDKLCALVERDGWTWRDGRLVSASAFTLVNSLKQLAVDLNSEHLHQHIRRIEDSIDSDPAQAIGSAKELVETVCKSIYSRRTRQEAREDDLPKLVRSTLKELSLVPDAISDAAKGADAIRRTLGNLANIVSGIAELRNWYGTGHGRDISQKGLKTRHARLVVGAAVTLVTFIFETDQEQQGGLLLENCPHCEGQGHGGVMDYPCPYCEGRGKVSAVNAAQYGTPGARYKICPSCNRASTIGIAGKECGFCGATGLIATNIL